MAGIVETSSLHRPLNAVERDEIGYSPAVERDLVAAFHHLAAGNSRPDAYLQAHGLAWRNLNKPMSARERMQAYFVLGASFLGGSEVRLGRSCLDEALDLAEDLHDWGASVELAHLHAAASGTVFAFADAVELLSGALAILHTFGVLPDDGPFQLDILEALALAHFMLEEFDAAWQALDEARTISRQCTDSAARLATLDWISALLYRWQGAPERALRPALAAAERYAEYVDTTPHLRLQLSRLYTDVAECALDLAELYPGGTARFAHPGLIALAEPYAERAVALAQDVSDPATEGIALLARCRLRRLSRGAADSLPLLEQVKQNAIAERDVALLTRVHTTMGHEFAQRGEENSALVSFRSALDVLGPSEIPALGRWARQALVAASLR